MKSAMKQSELIEELSTVTNMSKAKVTDLLKNLTNIAYREAVNGFTIPGICKLKIVRKKSSRYRSVATGKLMQLAERDILKVVLLKKAKDTVAPKPENIATEVPEEEIKPKAPPPPPAAAEEEVPTPEEQKRGIMGDGTIGNIVFACQGCGSMLSAELDNAGMAAQCPLCKVETIIPSNDAPAEAPSDDVTEENATDTPQDATTGEEFIIFVCQTCGQEIEAPVDMVRMNATCPTCGTSINVPEESQAIESSEPEAEEQEGEPHGPGWKSRTMRIDLSDLD